MPKFRKKPVVIHAEQFWLSEQPWPIGVSQEAVGYTNGNIVVRPLIHTLEGPMSVNNGDWIITGVRGEVYACRQDIFEETYERVEE